MSFRVLLIESGPLLDLVRALREEHGVVLKAGLAFAARFGSDGIYMSGGLFDRRPARVAGIKCPRLLPKGWKKSGRAGMMVPRKDAPILLDEMAGLPTHRNFTATLGPVIGWTGNLVEKRPQGGFTSLTLADLQLSWAGEAYSVHLPLHGPFGETSPRIVAHVMALAVPDGCREISAAEWELIMAQHKVAVEREAA